MKLCGFLCNDCDLDFYLPANAIDESTDVMCPLCDGQVSDIAPITVEAPETGYVDP